VSWPKIINCTITGNTVKGRIGGGISGYVNDLRSDQRGIYIINCSITGNSGRGLSILSQGYVKSLHVFITDSKIIGNTGGGIYFAIANYHDYIPQVSIVNTLVVQNTAGNYGGGIYIEGDPLMIGNDTIYHITNSTISGNKCKISGGGIFSESGVTP
jgi:predicted outer membrane repeat protein